MEYVDIRDVVKRCWRAYDPYVAIRLRNLAYDKLWAKVLSNTCKERR